MPDAPPTAAAPPSPGPATGNGGSALVRMLQQFAAELGPLVAGLDPSTVHANDAAVIVRQVVAVERRLAGLRLACAARAAASAAVAATGSRSAEHWYAHEAGVGLEAARRSLRTSERLQALGRTREHAMAGGLSEAQLDRVADAAAANPDSEGSLLAAAGRQGLRGLAAVCDRAKAEVRDEDQEQQRLAAVHRRRFLRHSRTGDGAFRLEVHTTPDAGARVMAAIDRRADDLFHVARRDGRREPHHAYQADALVDLVTTPTCPPGHAPQERATPASPATVPAVIPSPPGPSPQGPVVAASPDQVPAALPAPAPASAATPPPAARTGPAAAITFVVDIEALRRGHLAPGERCELTGVGSVPLSMVERYLADSRLDLVVTCHTDIRAVCSLSRTIPRALRTALELRDPTCVVPGCDVTSPLEIDHIVPFAQGGPTHIDNLCRLCSHHHDLKTYRNWTVTGPPGRWRFAAPPEPAEGLGGPRPEPSPDAAADRRRRPTRAPRRRGPGSSDPAAASPALFDDG